MPDSQPRPSKLRESRTAAAGPLEQADKDAAADAARHRHHPVVRTLGALSEVADQVPLSLVCGAVGLGGALSGRDELLRAGARMMAAHVLANVVKRAIKDRFRRTRPVEMIKGRPYRCEPGESRGGHETSFPSGHTAGAVAVAAVVAHDLPRAALPAWGVAAMIAGIQVPRGKHYPVDVVAGAVLGLAAAGAIRALWPARRKG